MATQRDCSAAPSAPPASMAEAPSMAPLPLPGKPPDAAATAPLLLSGKPPDAPATASLQAPGRSPAATATTPTKKSPSTGNKKTKGKLQSHPASGAELPVPKNKKPKLQTDSAPAADVPVPKKPKVKSAPNPAAKKTVEARTTTSKPSRSRGAVAAVVAVATAARSVVQTLDSAVADAGSADPPRQDVDADGQTTKQPSMPTLHSQLHEAGCSSKQKEPVSKQHKSSVTKRFKPPMAKFNSPMVTRSPIMRLVVSPLVVQPRSPALGLRRSLSHSPHSPQRSLSGSSWRSPSQRTWRSPSRTPRTAPAPARSPVSRNRGKPRKLRSTVWKDMDPIYEDGKLVQARCKHCYEVFAAARNWQLEVISNRVSCSQ